MSSKILESLLADENVDDFNKEIGRKLDGKTVTVDANLFLTLYASTRVMVEDFGGAGTLELPQIQEVMSLSKQALMSAGVTEEEWEEFHT